VEKEVVKVVAAIAATVAVVKAAKEKETGLGLMLRARVGTTPGKTQQCFVE
jgi:hypothetical protein